jgi:hypothetical protein
VFDKLKPLLTAPPDTITINPKYGKQYSARNVGGYMFFSNHSQALIIDKGERRLCYIDRIGVASALTRADWNFLHKYVLHDPVCLEIIGQYLHRRWRNMGSDAKADLFGAAPETAAKDQLRDEGMDAYDQLVADWVRDDDGLGPLWTTYQLRERLEQAKRSDYDLKGMTPGVLWSKLRDAGAWKPYKADRDGRVSGVGTGRHRRDTVWALYEDTGTNLSKDATYTQDQIRDMLTKQNAARGSNVTSFPSDKSDDDDDMKDFLN